MNYLVLKTTEDQIQKAGSVFEAIRGHWSLNPEHARQCDRVIAVCNKVIKEVFFLDGIYESTILDNKYVFSGVRDYALTDKYEGLEINPNLCLKGAENPVRYTNDKNLFEE